MPVDRTKIAELRRRHVAGLEQVARELTNRAKPIAVKLGSNTGARANSITHDPIVQEGRAAVLWGSSLQAAPYVQYTELGFRPHWVPMKHIFLWASRTGVGQIYTTRTRSGSGPSRAVRTYKRSRGVRLGLFVGGPGSRLQYGGGGATAKQFRGRRRVSVTYQTRGGKSEFLPAGKVGAPILQETVKRHGREAARAFVVGFSRGR